jgi:PAS domain S-box-containing protein
MNDETKNKTQLIAELTQLRRQNAQLKALLDNRHPSNLDQLSEYDRQTLTDKLQQIGAVLTSSLNYETVLDCLLEQVDMLIPHSAACILLISDGVVRVARWHNYTQFDATDSPALLTFKLKNVPALRKMYETGQPLVVSYTDKEPQWVYAPGQSWTKSQASTPIYIQDQIVGFLKVDSNTPGFFEAVLAQQLWGLAEQASIALRNARLYEQARKEINKRVVVLKKERNFVSAVLDTVGALVMVVTPKGRILRFNQACEQTTGYTFDEVKGKFFWDIFLTSAEAEKTKITFKSLQLAKSPKSYESYWLTKGGKQRIITWSNNVLRGNENEVEYIISTGIDITERRQLEERLLAIHHLGRELNLLRDEVDICNIALETASFLLPLKSSGYGVFDEVTNDLAYYYYPIRGAPKVIDLRLPLNREKRLQALIEHSGEITDALEVDEASPATLRPDGQVERFWLSAPMKIGEKIVGVLDVKSQEPDAFSSNDQQLLQTLADQTAVAIENARLHRETNQRVDELATLSMISQTITSTLNLEVTLTIITDHTIRLLDATAASVVLLDEERSDLWFYTASGGVSDFVRGIRLPAGQGIVGWVIEHGEPALVVDVSQDPRFFGEIDQQTGFITRSVICIPLQTEQETIGAIEVMNKTNGVFNQEDLRLLSWLATPATIAIENARLFEAESKARQQAEILREATSTLTSTLDLNRLLDSILIHLERVVPYDNAYVFLQEQDLLKMVAGRGSAPIEQQIVGYQYPANNPIYQEIRRTSRPVILADAQNDERIKSWRNVDHIRGWMGVPLITANKVIGCLTLNSRQTAAFDQTEASLAQAFAHQATVAIQNAQLFEQVRASHRQLRSLSHRLVQVQETERRHIARELHDEAGQALTSLMVGLRLLERDAADNPQSVIERVNQLKSTTNDVLENLHRLAMDLRPATLDHLGLTAALRQYIEIFSRQHNIKTQFEIVGLDDAAARLPPAFETNLYRIVQEALTNVVRHAKATRVDVLLERRDNQMITIIEDNGVGFDSEAAGSGRLGLLGMRERAEMMGGSLVIESTLGANTTIYVEVPYDDTNIDIR